MADSIDLEQLKQKLANLGVQVSLSSKPATPNGRETRENLGSTRQSSRKRCGKVEAALHDVRARTSRPDVNAAAPAQPPWGSDIGHVVDPRGSKGTRSAPRSVHKYPSISPPAARPDLSKSVDLTNVSRSSPLASVLSQYRQAQLAWGQEKAQLRRELTVQRKRANNAALELKRIERLHSHKLLDISALKGALKTRDDQLQAAQERVKDLEHIISRSAASEASRVEALETERNDLKSLLLATLQRLQSLDELVARTDMSSSLMEKKVEALEQQCQQAEAAAADARAEAAQMSDSQKRLQAQAKLLEAVSQVQQRHNRRKARAIKDLLGADAAAAAELGGSLLAANSSSSRRAGDSGSNLLDLAAAAAASLVDEAVGPPQRRDPHWMT